jgi:hypothetical protein
MGSREMQFMTNPYSPFCEDFYVNMRLGSQLTFPHNRETVLHLFERIQRSYPSMTRFRKNDNGEYTLEEDRGSHTYRWISLESKRLTSGHVNPATLDESLAVHKQLLEMAPHHMGISPLEIDYLDVLFGFDLGFGGNHDEIIAESLFQNSPLTCLTDETGAKAVDFQPTVTVSLSDDCRLQARIDVVTRTNSYQVRTGDYADDVISVYLIVRRYWGDRPRESFENMFVQLAEKADQLCMNHVVPRILRPISTAISSRS